MKGLLGEGGPKPEVLKGPVGLVVPHAGYIYSGPTAAAGYKALRERGRPEGVVILGTNHTGLGGAVTVAPPEPWETPLGEVPVHEELLEGFSRLPGVVQDPLPFLREHSVEVQLPFIQFLFGDVPFVPAVVLADDPVTLAGVGRGLAELVSGRGIALIASTDFTHYEPHLVAKRKDMAAIERIRSLDLEGFLRIVRELSISICGVGAIGILIAAARELGLGEVDLVSYTTSGETSGYFEEVVGYASLLFQPP